LKATIDQGSDSAMADTHSTGAPVGGTLPTGQLSTGTEATPPSEHGGGFPPFQRETFGSQILWVAITFGALYLIVSKLALPRVSGIIADRRARIAGDLAEAARMKDAADAAIASYEKSLADARAKAQTIAALTRDKVSAEAEARRKEVEASLHAKLAAAEQTIAATRIAAMANVQGIAKEAAIAIVARLTGKAPAEDAAAAAVKAAIDR
jgi:F-type H+-transporting ATPase subunit b